MCKKEYEAEPRTGIMGEADVLVAASAPGKCILFGEHAVVYGQPAVAVAIEQRLSISATKAASWSVDGSALDPTRHPPHHHAEGPLVVGQRANGPACVRRHPSGIRAGFKRRPECCGRGRHAPAGQPLKGH